MNQTEAPDPARFCCLWCRLTAPHHDTLTQLLLNTRGYNPCPWQDNCPHPFWCLDIADPHLARTCPRATRLHHDSPTPACRCHKLPLSPSRRSP